MRAFGRRLGALWAWGLAACGSAQHHEAAANQAPEEIQLDEVTVHPADTEASEAPPSGTPIEQAARHALDVQLAGVAQCYATTLHSEPDAHGRIDVDVVFLPNGHVDRVTGHIDGEGGIGTARRCIEAALRGSVMEATTANGARVRRSYVFANPSVEISLAEPVTITAPRRHHREEASPSPAPATSATGPLGDTEISSTLAAHESAFQSCYGHALHASRTAEGGATLVLTIAADGSVSNARFTSEVPAIASESECAETAARAFTFRASGTAATVHASLVFHR